MRKFYKFEENDILYEETWYNQKRNIIVIHSGKVGEIGETKEFSAREPVHENTNDEIAIYFQNFTELCAENGYFPLTTDQTYLLVIQFPLTTKDGEQKDLWFKDKVCQILNEDLGWTGLGSVDGYDIGMYQLNIFCIVCTNKLAVQSVNEFLEKSRLNDRNYSIATRKFTEQHLVQQFSTDNKTNFQLL